jgi:hypothetical protein
MATITGTTINSGITLSTSGNYASPLTITSTGAVDASSGDAIYGDSTQPWTVANYGTVTATAGIGINLAAGGTIVDSGTISGSGTAVQFGGTSGNLLVLEPGYKISGSVVGSGSVGATNTLELASAASAGILSGLGISFVNFGTVTVDAGARWTLSGINTIAAGGSLTNHGTLINGVDLAAGGIVNGAIASITGSVGAGGGFGTAHGGTGHVGGAAIILSGSLTNHGTIAGGAGGRGGNAQVFPIQGVGGNGGVGGAGVSLTGGGSLTNSGAISGGKGGYYGGGYTNGIGGAGGIGVILIAGGGLANSGTISGGRGAGYGSYYANAPGTGVYLKAGGSVGNAAGGLIQGGAGLTASGTFAATVTNSGTIIGSAGIGIDLAAGGTVVDSGTISGSGTAVRFGGTGGSLLVLEPGYKFTGSVISSASYPNTVELAGSLGSPLTVGYNALTLSNFTDVLFGTAGSDTLKVSNTGGTLPVTISGFALTSDIIDLTAIGSTGSITSQSSTLLTVTGLLGSETLKLDPSDGTAFTTMADGLSGTELVACFCRGTLILTETGQVPVEDLAIGDHVVTLSGAARPVKWIGHRAYDPRFVAGNRAVLPIRVEAGVLGDGVPARDLFVSPEHALYLPGSSPGTGLLVPARLLVNGITICQIESIERLEYFHIELDTPDVILADGAPAESYVECDNRGMFHNAGEFAALYPDEPPEQREFSAPRVEEDSAGLTAIRTALLARATALGRTSADPDLHLIADGEIVRAQSRRGGICQFAVAPGTRRVALASRRAVPAEVYPDSLDGRALGVPVERIILCGAGLRLEIGHDCPALGNGFHDDEAAHRWSDGRGCLPEGLLGCFAGAIAIEVRLAETALIYPALSPATAADPDATDDLQQSASAAPADRPAAAAGPSGPAALRGYIDVIRPDRICGWAQFSGDPEQPVALDIHVGGRRRGQVVAGRYRADLQGLGSGRHAFEFTPPLGWRFAPGSVEVRPSRDGAPLARTTQLTHRLARAGS